MRPTAIALIDGEHYPPVVAWAIERLRERLDVRAALLLGGREKLRHEPEAAAFGVERLERAGPDAATALGRLVAAVRPAVVVDLSDEPVVSQRERLLLASVALAGGAGFEAGGTTIAPAPADPYPHPSIAVAGTGKRVGKTAVAGKLARVARDRLAPLGEDVCIVAMGRGGPAEPELVDPSRGPIDAAGLMKRSRAGAHAASDYLEDAVFAGVATIGARRCGGGLAGDVRYSNVAEAAALAAARAPGLTIFEGSGAALPPIACDRTLLVASTVTPAEELLGYLGPYRLLIAAAVVLVGSEERGDLVDGIRRIAPALPVVRARLRPAPSASLAGRRVAVFTTARPASHAALRDELERRHGADVVALSGALADRTALARDLAGIGPVDAFVTEIKAAAIDVVAEAAAARGVELVLCDNEPYAADGSARLDELLTALVDGARRPRGESEP